MRKCGLKLGSRFQFACRNSAGLTGLRVGEGGAEWTGECIGVSTAIAESANESMASACGTSRSVGVAYAGIQVPMAQAAKGSVKKLLVFFEARCRCPER